MPGLPPKSAFDFTLDEIRSWGGERQYLEALEQYANKGDVRNPKYENHVGEADIHHAGHSLHTRFRTFPGKRHLVENLCPCASSQRDGRVCVHMLAAAIGLAQKAKEMRSARTDANRKASEIAKESVAPTTATPRAGRAAAPRQPRPVFDPNREKAEFFVPDNWLTRYNNAGEVPLAISVSAGAPRPYSLKAVVNREIPFEPTPEEDDILFTLEHIMPLSRPEAAGKNLPLTRQAFFMVLDRLAENRIPLRPAKGTGITVKTMGEALPTTLHVTIDEATGQLDLALGIRIPDAPEGTFPDYVVYRDATDWRNDRVYALYDNVLWPLKTPIPSAYGDVYFKPSYRLQRKETIDFIRKEYRGEIPLAGSMKSLRDLLGDDFDSQVDYSVFTIKPGRPTFRLEAAGSRASIALALKAVYSGLPSTQAPTDGAETEAQSIVVDVVAANPAEQFAIPDPKDNFYYYSRNPDAEQRALARLAERGIAAPTSDPDDGDPIRYVLPKIVGDDKVLHFLATVVPALRRRGWDVSLGDSLGDFLKEITIVAPRIRIVDHPEKNGFEIGYTLASKDGSVVLTEEDIANSPDGITARTKDGHPVIFDRQAVEELDSVISECAGLVHRKGLKHGPHGEPQFLSNAYAHFVKKAIDILSGSEVTLENPPEDWTKAADIATIRKNLKPVPLEDPIRSLLRPYQTLGVAWLRYLECQGQAGILADEMGLGKTIQTLAWISLPRVSGSKAPALVVCPTSLVYNWLHEARHFVPHLKTIAISGAQRHEDFERIPDSDIVITSYALMRRDIDQYRELSFSAVILDEAQNIKNQNTLSARSVKQLDKTACRLVVTGTPIENSVSDMWSIMDFLMPGYLGHYETFRRTYEEPLQQEPGSDAYHEASLRLRDKLAPFLLRRLKTQVAKDLPPKIVRTSWCELTAEQRKVYDRILEESRMQVSDSVHREGFEKSRMLILTALLRLRQICCHLALLDDNNIGKRGRPKAHEEPSSKLEQLFQILDVAMSQGHRVLVFSQFVKMLHILRREFDKRKIRYCYLDGSSKDRLESVQRFNNDASIPVFLISLKAGGTGLNLTGADEVVHFDPWWNPAVEDQATDRAHRIGQKNTVYSLRMITSGTIEERVLQMQRRKRAIIDSTVEGDEQTMSKLTWADVKKLLDLD